MCIRDRKITSEGRAPRRAAIVSRDSSTRRRAARPAVCSEDALPTIDSAAAIASMAAGCIGVEAAWSRYTDRVWLIAHSGYRPGQGRPAGQRVRRLGADRQLGQVIAVPAAPNFPLAARSEVAATGSGQLQAPNLDADHGVAGPGNPVQRRPQ